jgi:hypothetical protein
MAHPKRMQISRRHRRREMRPMWGANFPFRTLTDRSLFFSMTFGVRTAQNFKRFEQSRPQHPILSSSFFTHRHRGTCAALWRAVPETTRWLDSLNRIMSMA